MEISFKLLGYVVLSHTLTLLFLNITVYRQYWKKAPTSSPSVTNVFQRTEHKVGLVKARKYLTEEEIFVGNNTIVFDKMAKASYSQMYISGSNSRISLGDEIRVRIDLFDGYGKRKSVGGDYIRLWIEDVRHGASAAGDVMDHNNGSYTGVLRAVWVGSAEIRASIARRREEIALYYKIYKEFGSTWIIYAKFIKGKLEESTDCGIVPSPDPSHRWCNFTSWNWGFPWYCRRPSNPELPCSTWKKTSSNIHLPSELDTTERRVLTWATKNNSDILPQSVRVDIIKSSNKTPLFAQEPTPCNTVPSYMTWQQKSPSGFYYNDVWRPRLCKNILQRTKSAYRSCLKGRQLWIPGDSTSNQFLRVLNHTMALYYKEPSDAHDPQKAFDKRSNVSVMWYAHELPFYHGARLHTRSGNKAQGVILDQLPNTTRDIVVLYLYAHFTLVHPDVFRGHVRQLVHSVKKLLARAPKVTVAVRGPHAFHRSNRIGVISYWGLLYADILDSEFSSVKDRVVYLNYWDMMVGNVFQIHPPYQTVQQMVHHMLSMLCFRK